MLSPDIINLRQFYASPLGELAQSLIGQQIRQLWPDAKGEELLAVGYGVPYIEHYIQHGARAYVSMPARQGAAYWPPAADNLALMAHSSELPFKENSFNRVLLVHSVENSELLPDMLEEVWRVLTPGGRVLVVVPNRNGMWSRSAHTPFGYGRPFSLHQIRDLLAAHQFTFMRSKSSLFLPPTRIQSLWKLAKQLEILGHCLCPFFGGVWLVEAEKQLYASVKQTAQRRRRHGSIIPATQPAMTRS